MRATRLKHIDYKTKTISRKNLKGFVNPTEAAELRDNSVWTVNRSDQIRRRHVKEGCAIQDSGLKCKVVPVTAARASQHHVKLAVVTHTSISALMTSLSKAWNIYKSANTRNISFTSSCNLS